MKPFRWQVFLGISLVVLSAILYVIHFFIFRDSHHIFIYMIGDIAFVPVEVLLVTLIIHRLLGEREKRHRLEKLNMVIGAFFSEVGTRLLVSFSDFDPNLDKIRNDLIITGEWSEKEFSTVSDRLRSYDYSVEIHKVDLEVLRVSLIEKRDFLVRLLENPNLLEHESFTDLLRAVFHLTEEDEYRVSSADSRSGFEGCRREKGVGVISEVSKKNSTLCILTVTNCYHQNHRNQGG
jgi:hypothetical protein